MDKEHETEWTSVSTRSQYKEGIFLKHLCHRVDGQATNAGHREKNIYVVENCIKYQLTKMNCLDTSLLK